MTPIVFQPSAGTTLGVEIELGLVDSTTGALRSGFSDVRAGLPTSLHARVKPELMQCYLEINTDVCHSVADVATDLRDRLLAVEASADACGLGLCWTATHPFSLWQDQVQTEDDRYARLIAILQDMGRQLVTFGLHVHVGVDSGDKAVMICNRIMRHLPTMLALSANSPYWNNRITGLQSNRSKIMEGLPTAGLPSLMRNWSEYVWLVNQMVETGFINSIRDIWWDVRPHHNFGTVEIRVSDMPRTLDEVLAITALTQCLVRALSEEIDAGTYQHDCHPMLVRQNKWRAARFGLEAHLVDEVSHQARPVRQVLRDLVERLLPTAETLGCVEALRHVAVMASRPTGADRQLALDRDLHDPAAVVARLVAESRISPPRA